MKKAELGEMSISQELEEDDFFDKYIQRKVEKLEVQEQTDSIKRMEELNNPNYHLRADFTQPLALRSVSTFNMVESLARRELPFDPSQESSWISDPSVGIEMEFPRQFLAEEPTRFINDLSSSFEV